MMIVLPGMADTDIGRGIDFFNADLAGTPFDPATIPNVAVQAVPGSTTRFFSKLVEDSSDIAKTLEVSAQASFGVGAFSGRVSADYSRTISANSYSLFMVGMVDVELTRTGYLAGELARLRLAPEILTWFKLPSDLKRFRQAYGDQFVTGSVKGGTLNFIVEIETHSLDDKAKLTAEASASGATWSAQASFKATLNTLQKSRRVTAHIYQAGGDWKFDQIDADTLFKALLDFPAQIAKSPVTRALEVQSYDGIQNWPAAVDNYPSLSAAGSTLTAFQGWREKYDALLNDVDYVRANLVAFERADSVDLADLRSEIEQEAAKLDQGFMDLVSDPINSLNLKPANVARDPDDFRARLPHWREGLPSCAKDILAANASAPDGEYDLWLGGDRTKRVKLYCRMADTPREYLTLQQPNTSMLRGDNVGGDYPGYTGTDVVTRWERIRIDPHTLEVDIKDFFGSTSTGGPTAHYTEIAFGSASQCGGDAADFAYANVDITGTPFVFHPSMSFGVLNSYNDTGHMMAPATGQTAAYAARGRCSGWGPAVGGVNRLILKYDGPSRAT
ncbi:hypothetical protein JJE66_12865 [Bradyrhizobium diazoefficiens]|uniref:GON domain-containing protein n=1 Tax=Bradyrhizobium diazoefficiens TaxID=1355477 RepID=UPI00190E19C3|nr:GON domain-containing protein [Bradyrhizobium diazoefficiens]MBK3662138.1 hypothetical protein [Bradyrhizobium diazoefficiens]